MFYTERLMLRNVDLEADFKYLLQMMNNVDSAWAMTASPPTPASRDQAKKLIERTSSKESKLPFFIICDRPKEGEGPDSLAVDDDLFMKDGKVRYPAVGMLNVGNAGEDDPAKRIASLGIALNKDHQDNGYGSEILKWAIKYCFETLRIHKIELQADASNARALHVYEKIGFVREGLRRERLWKEGHWGDMVELGFLEEEYFESRLTNTDTK